MEWDNIWRISHDYPYLIDVNKYTQAINELKKSGINPTTMYQELKMRSRFLDTHVDASFEGKTIILHSHNFYEVLFCINSCNVEYLVGTERYRLQRGDIVIIPPGTSHRPLLAKKMKEPYLRCVIWFSNEFYQNFLRGCEAEDNTALSNKCFLRTAGTKWEFLESLFKIGADESRKKRPGWSAAVEGNGLYLLTLINRAISDGSTAEFHAENQDLFDRAVEYIEKQLQEKITLEGTAHYFFVSQSTISQIFRKKANTSFYRFVTQRRLIAAKKLITEGFLLEDVGNKVGFADYATFYRAFKHEYSVSPRQFKKIINGDKQ